MNELKELILALKRPDNATAKYVIETELDDLMQLIETYTAKVSPEINIFCGDGYEPKEEMKKISDIINQAKIRSVIDELKCTLGHISMDNLTGSEIEILLDDRITQLSSQLKESL